MNKQEFIETLHKKLSKLPQKEVEDRIAFYSEMIDDKIEDGISEENAVNEIGDINDVASQIVAEIPLTKIVKENIKPKRKLGIWEIVAIVAGAPVWVPVLVALCTVVFTVYASLWAGVVSLWACVVSLFAVSVYGIVFGGIMMFCGNTFINLVLFSIGVVSVGLGIFLCFGCLYVTKGLIVLTKKITLSIKNSFVKKEVK